MRDARSWVKRTPSVKQSNKQNFTPASHYLSPVCFCCSAAAASDFDFSSAVAAFCKCDSFVGFIVCCWFTFSCVGFRLPLTVFLFTVRHFQTNTTTLFLIIHNSAWLSNEKFLTLRSSFEFVILSSSFWTSKDAGSILIKSVKADKKVCKPYELHKT